MINLLKKAIRKEAIKKHKAIVDYNSLNLNKDFRNIFDFITKIKEQIDCPCEYHDCMNIYFSALNSKKIQGDAAVFGIYAGASAKLVCEAMNGERNVYLFDTFSRCPEPSNKYDKGHFWEEKYNTNINIEETKEYLKDYNNVIFCKGIFPKDTSDIIKDKKFCFVHVDFNLYVSTKETLEFMYPRMNKRGIMLFDDYFAVKGVKKSVSEFFKNRPEVIIYSNNNQVMVVKQ